MRFGAGVPFLFLAFVINAADAKAKVLTCDTHDLVGIQPFQFPTDFTFPSLPRGITLAITLSPDGAFGRIQIISSSKIRSLDRAVIGNASQMRLSGDCMKKGTGQLFIEYVIKSDTDSGSDAIVEIWRESTKSN